MNEPEEIRHQLEIFDTTIRMSIGQNVNALIHDLKQASATTYE